MLTTSAAHSRPSVANSTRRRAIPKRLLRLTLLAALIPYHAVAQTSPDDVEDSAREDYPRAHRLVEEVVTIGTRHRARAAVDTPVPVDFFDAETIESVNSSDLLDIIAQVVPSFFLRRFPIADGAAFIRPTALRGLDSHHTLVLVNGKRQHRSALVGLFGFGPHGADISSIPSGAIASMEVLRDGAAAQYGSDAIAGVINFNLDSSNSGMDFSARYGGYTEGDGEELKIEGSSGFPLGQSGFLFLSGQYAKAQPTSRSQFYDLAIGESGIKPHEATHSRRLLDGVTYFGPDAHTYVYGPAGELLQVLPGSDGVPDDLDRRFAENFHRIGGGREFDSPAQIWGQPEREQWMGLFNAELPISSRLALYSFGNYSRRDQTGGFFYRRPGVSQLLPVRLADGSIYDPRAALYPSGFTPQFSGKVSDTKIVAGIRGQLTRLLGYDLSAGYGKNKIAYSIANTMNPSLGPETPTSFRPGDLTNDEIAANADFSLEFGRAGDVQKHMAFGMEYRREGYKIGEGGEASYALGPFARRDPFNFEITRHEVDADPDDAFASLECRIPGFEAVGSLCPAGDPINNALAVGSNGFPGYPPAFASDYDRVSYAAYLEFGVEFSDRWLTDIALRYEDFEDFGSVGIGKLAMAYGVTQNINLRGSVGTGFRAPTPGQISTTNVSTRINAQGFPVAQGVFPSNHPASGLFGGQPLKAEDAVSFTFGATASLVGGLSLTIDYYHAELSDRIVLSSVFELDDRDRTQLQALGVVGATDIAELRFFTNDVDTRTSGVDLVASYQLDSPIGSTEFSAAINHNRTEVLERGAFVDLETQYDLEHALPNMRATLSVSHVWNALELLARVRYYGKYRNAADNDLKEIQQFDPQAMFDLQGAWNFGNGVRLKLGTENLFDNYPQAARYEACCGAIYRSDSIVPWQGRLVYAQLLAELH